MTGGYKLRDPGSLKEAESLLVYVCGGLEKAARILDGRVGRAQIGRYTDQDNVACHMPADVIRMLERAAGDPVVTRYLAMEARAMLVAIPGAAQESGYLEFLGLASEEQAHLIRTTMDALADGKVTPKEAAEIKGRILKSVAAISVLITRLDRVIESREDDLISVADR